MVSSFEVLIDVVCCWLGLLVEMKFFFMGFCCGYVDEVLMGFFRIREWNFFCLICNRWIFFFLLLFVMVCGGWRDGSVVWCFGCVVWWRVGLRFLWLYWECVFEFFFYLDCVGVWVVDVDVLDCFLFEFDWFDGMVWGEVWLLFFWIVDGFVIFLVRVGWVGYEGCLLRYECVGVCLVGSGFCWGWGSLCWFCFCFVLLGFGGVCWRVCLWVVLGEILGLVVSECWGSGLWFIFFWFYWICCYGLGWWLYSVVVLWWVFCCVVFSCWVVYRSLVFVWVGDRFCFGMWWSCRILWWWGWGYFCWDIRYWWCVGYCWFFVSGWLWYCVCCIGFCFFGFFCCFCWGLVFGRGRFFGYCWYGWRWLFWVGYVCCLRGYWWLV